MPPVLFDHVAIGVRRLSEAAAVVAGPLGGQPDFGADQGEFRFGQWVFAGGGRIEVLEPLGADGFLHRFLERRGPGVHHVTFTVPDLALACRRAEDHGYAITGYDDSNPGWKEAFLHPRQALGIVVQIAQPGRRGAPPPGARRAPGGPPDAPPPVTLLGLRCRARSPERARVQWEQVLGGTRVAESAREETYAWPPSPLRLTVEVDPAGEEGPVCLEYQSDRDVALPEGRHPVLGTAFRRG